MERFAERVVEDDPVALVELTSPPPCAILYCPSSSADRSG